LAKNLKLNIKNTQIAEGINLGSLKDKLAKKKAEASEETDKVAAKSAKNLKSEQDELAKTQGPEAPRIKARSKSAFAEGAIPEAKPKNTESDLVEEPVIHEEPKHSLREAAEEQPKTKVKTSEELRQEIFAQEIQEMRGRGFGAEQTKPKLEEISKVEETPSIRIKAHIPVEKPPQPAPVQTPTKPLEPYVKLGPTGRHINDLLPPKPLPKKEPFRPAPPKPSDRHAPEALRAGQTEDRTKPKAKVSEAVNSQEPAKTAKVKEYRDIKPPKRTDGNRSFDGRDRQGLRDDEDQRWRKKRYGKQKTLEPVTIRPTSLKVRVPISIKDLASDMKLKSSQLVAKLFLQGVIMTLNDLLDDETTIQLLGQEFGCDITIDSSEEERIRITDKSIKEEILGSDQSKITIRPPVVAFMGHVDHGKTSLIDAIRKSNRAAGEAGAITQHIGAFRCSTAVGDITILDTPGHEAFSAMRARGADVTDIVVLVVAGDEGIRQQTLEAIQHAKAAGVTIVVAINKSDKPNFNPENVYRQLAENNLLPEAWGGAIITVNCSAVTGQGIPQLLEMLALQAEILELKANPESRARGSVLESEMHKGMGIVATVLVQNGTLRLGDAIVFGQLWGRVKTMQNEYGQLLQEAPPSTPVEITGLSGLPEAGQEFIVVKSEKEAREIAEVRMEGLKESNLLLKKKVSMENLLQQSSQSAKKILNVVLRADVQGSLEALKVVLQKIESAKAELNIIFAGVGEVSESDVQLAAASKAVILGFHTHIESHAESLVKQMGIQVRLHDIIYHAVDDVKDLLAGLLDKIAIETDKGKAEVRATFKSSSVGIIAGCYVTEGAIQRSNHIRIKRDNKVVHKGQIASLKRVRDDVREVAKGLECGILINNFTDIQEGDILEAYEVTYISQEL